MVERRIELRRQRRRKEKMRKLKAKLSAVGDSREKEKVLTKIRKLCPWWRES